MSNRVVLFPRFSRPTLPQYVWDSGRGEVDHSTDCLLNTINNWCLLCLNMQYKKGSRNNRWSVSKKNPTIQGSPKTKDSEVRISQRTTTETLIWIDPESSKIREKPTEEEMIREGGGITTEQSASVIVSWWAISCFLGKSSQLFNEVVNLSAILIK